MTENPRKRTTLQALELALNLYRKDCKDADEKALIYRLGNGVGMKGSNAGVKPLIYRLGNRAGRAHD